MVTSLFRHVKVPIFATQLQLLSRTSRNEFLEEIANQEIPTVAATRKKENPYRIHGGKNLGIKFG
jgi:hypothetical protein